MPGVAAAGRYVLTPLAVEHVTDRYVAWLNDPRVNQYLEVRHEPQTLESVRAYVESFHGNLEKYGWAIVDTHQGNEMIGTCSLGGINRHHGFGWLGVMIGDSAHWGTGCATQALEQLLAFGFETVGLRRITGGCYSCNPRMAHRFRKLGFVHEGTMRQAYCLTSGHFVDAYSFGLLADEWRGRKRSEVST